MYARLSGRLFVINHKLLYEEYEMMVKQLLRNALMLGVLVTLGACTTSQTTQQMLEDVPGGGQQGGAGQTDATGIGGDGSLAIDILDEEGGAGAGRAGGLPYRDKTIYFDYNSSEIRDEFLPEIIRMAKALENNPRMQARLEGHADERGTREYNLALGERRAQEVRHLILLQGAKEDQVDIVSYGEEKPAAFGEGDSAWTLNRRVELVY